MLEQFAVNVLGPRKGIKQTFKFADEQQAVEKQNDLEMKGLYVEFVNLNFFPKRQKNC